MYRRKLGKSKVNNIHRFVSPKNGSTVLTESTLEFHSCYSLEYDREVKSFESQPEGFEYIDGNKVRRYTPDHLVRMASGQEPYIEVKPLRIAKRKDFLDRFYCQRDEARRLGRDLWLWTEELIRKQPYLGNLQILHKYRNNDPITAEHRHVLDRVSSFGNHGVSIQELALSSGMGITQLLPLTYDLIARNQLDAELHSSPLTKESLVQIRS
ncbi:TnsA endonuclease N-terminal domain-containing protein [Endozoicomonas ascidiicola]|uniref:TnsA endonuclease N-terminal domain-containing protein n=1 Tax=Endozoicomonas ascidiicola TaxID=1698521 RepID=UPI0008324680|nr:TnsA endonuclease N-terminal domain-containing protein [Endozoicomonas ascidiicola]